MMGGVSIEKVNGIVNDRCERLERRIIELEAKLQCQDDLTARIISLEANYLFLKHHNTNLQRMVDDNEQYSRKTNLILNGIRIPKSSNDNEIRAIVIDEIVKMDCGVLDQDVDRAHRTGKSFKDKNGVFQTPIIVRFKSWHARNKTYSARKKSSGYWSADLTKRRQELLKTCQQKIKDPSLARYISAVFVDRNCSITLLSNDKRFLKFNTLEEFYRQVSIVENGQQPYVNIWKNLDIDKSSLASNIVNLKNFDINLWSARENHVYIGGSHENTPESIWANPLQYDNRQYEEYVKNNDSLVERLGELKGKVLGCWCSTDCHGEVLHKLVGNEVVY